MMGHNKGHNGSGHNGRGHNGKGIMGGEHNGKKLNFRCRKIVESTQFFHQQKQILKRFQCWGLRFDFL